MKKASGKQIVTAAFLAAAVGLTGAPLSAGAVGDNSDRNSDSWNRDSERRDNERRDNERRIISEWQARRIAQNVFPRKHIVRVTLSNDNNNNNRYDNNNNNNNRREYRVYFADGSRVDVRARDGQVTYAHRANLYTWR
ncbi:MAG: hypothetical protein WAZ21_02975 [Candidatus Saccharimonadales bacterium]